MNTPNKQAEKENWFNQKTEENWEILFFSFMTLLIGVFIGGIFL